jgi:hypothetical protein
VHAQTGLQVLTRAADHPTFSRLVFSVRDQIINYQIADNNRTVTITFDNGTNIQLSGVPNNLQYMNGLSSQQTSTGTVVTFTRPVDTVLQDFREGFAIVVDVLPDPSKRQQVDDAANAQNNGAGGTGNQANTADGTDSTTDTTGDDPRTDDEEDKTGEATTEGGGETDKPDEFSAVNTNTTGTTGDTGAPGQISINNNIGLDNAPELPISVESIGDKKSLIFEWKVPVSAAVFKRAGYLWVVFDEAAIGDLSAVMTLMNESFTEINQSNAADLTVMRFGLVGDPNIVVNRTESVWKVTLQPTFVEPSMPIAVIPQTLSGGESRLFAPIDSPGNHIIVSDPLVGDTLDIVPIYIPGQGSVNGRRYSVLRILQSGQGLVVEKLSDNVVVTRYTNGAAIGCVLCAPGVFETGSGLSVDADGERDGSAIRLINYEKWRLGGLENFNNNRQALFRELVTVPVGETNEKRWKIAQFYLSHKMAAESLAMMTLMEEVDTDLASNDHRFKAVRGMAKFSLQQYTAAKVDMDDRRLDAEPDINLWRMLVEEALGNHEKAFDYFEKGRELLSNYDIESIIDFRLSAVRSALSLKRADAAQGELAQIKLNPLTRFQEAETLYLEGRLWEQLGDTPRAVALFGAVDERANRRANANARFAIISSRLERKEIQWREAAEKMEWLRYAWRGDDFELNLLQKLGYLYIDGGEYRRGLDTLREALAAFPDHANTRDIANKMTAAFRALYLDEKAESLDPVAAVSLFYEFRELTPLGADGDRMIRRLVERLVALDLLGRAAELLDYQVKARLEGAAQAQVATQLAKIFMMDRKPQAALEMLRLTRQTQLPEQIQNDRLTLEARALVMLKRFEEAEVLLFGVSGADANSIRADIYWGAADWPRVAMVSLQMLNNRWQVTDPLVFEERQLIMRYVIALSMQEDAGSLGRIRAQYMPLMEGGRFSNAFNLITSTSGQLTGSQLGEVVKGLAGIDVLRSFMENYKKEFARQS